jgi:hypothetical protein
MRYQFLVEVELLKADEEASRSIADVVLQQALTKARPDTVPGPGSLAWLVTDWHVISIEPDAFIEYDRDTFDEPKKRSGKKRTGKKRSRKT